VRESTGQRALLKFSPVFQFVAHEVLVRTREKVSHDRGLLFCGGADGDVSKLWTMTASEDEHLESIGTQGYPRDSRT
jgi:hypothetical protein